MNRAVLLSLLFAVALVSVRADGTEIDDPDTIVLTNDNFDSVVNSEDLMLVEFYAPWCGHCKALAPTYAQAATTLKSHDPPIKIAKLDATKHSETAGRFSVSGYPTLKVFRNGKPSDYKGPRDHDGIVNYMKKQVGPAAKPVDTEAALEKFLKDPNNDFWLLGLFQSGAPSTLQSSFLVLANKLREDYVFLKSTNPDLLKKYEVEGEAIVALKNYDDFKSKYTGKSNTKAVEEWIEAQSVPIVGEWTARSAERYQKKSLPILKLYTARVDFTGSNKKQTHYYVNRLKQVALDKRGTLYVAIADMDKFSSEMESVGLKGKKDSVVIFDDNHKYVMAEPFSADNLKAFVEKFLNDELQHYVKSEEPPADNSGPVKVVTGRTFSQIVDDPEKDVMIEFYAPWCGHCKSLEPKYKELGQKLKKHEKLVIAKMDATANDYPSEYQVSGYPTIYFKPAGGAPTKYEGGREVGEMESFIKQKAKTLKKKKD